MSCLHQQKNINYQIIGQPSMLLTLIHKKEADGQFLMEGAIFKASFTFQVIVKTHLNHYSWSSIDLKEALFNSKD